MQFPLLTAPLSCRVQCTFAILTVFYYRINRNINTITRHYYVCMYVCIIPAAQAVEGQDHLGHQQEQDAATNCNLHKDTITKQTLPLCYLQLVAATMHCNMHFQCYIYITRTHALTHAGIHTHTHTHTHQQQHYSPPLCTSTAIQLTQTHAVYIEVRHVLSHSHQQALVYQQRLRQTAMNSETCVHLCIVRNLTITTNTLSTTIGTQGQLLQTNTVFAVPRALSGITLGLHTFLVSI